MYEKLVQFFFTFYVKEKMVSQLRNFSIMLLKNECRKNVH